MKNRIGFITETQQFQNSEAVTVPAAAAEPIPSVVQVYFEQKNRSLSYYNDRFDLRCGDMVYVEGKLEGCVGRVVEVSRNFKIRLSDYKRVVGVVEREVHGRFYMAGSHFITFDRCALPYTKALSWYKWASEEEEGFAVGFDGSSFPLSDLKAMKVSDAIGERGLDYYMENKVRYLCIDGGKGRAIVAGTQPYELEFSYHQGEISRLVCSCFCSYTCKHQVAAMLQLRELLKIIEEHYPRCMEESDFFSAVFKVDFFRFAVDGKETGSFTL